MLESISLQGCWFFGFTLLGPVSQVLLRPFMRLLQIRSLPEVVSRLQAGNIEEVWALLYVEMDNSLVPVIDEARAFVANASAPASLLTFGWNNLRVLKFVGYVGEDLPAGSLALFSVFSGGSLVEVDISYCDQTLLQYSKWWVLILVMMPL